MTPPGELADNLDPAFSTLAQSGVRGLVVMNNPALTALRAQVVALALKNRMPAIYEYGAWPTADGLMSYVDRILRGAKVADIPVLQPTNSS